jgi:hypothetical protein
MPIAQPNHNKKGNIPMAMQATTKRSFSRRWEDYQASKTVLFWSCAAAAVVTMIIGFGWGGWVTGSTSRSMATTAATEARGDLAAAICVERFMAAPDSAARLVQLKAIPESYKKRQFVEAGGWATMPGQTSPDSRGAEACAVTLTV